MPLLMCFWLCVTSGVSYNNCLNMGCTLVRGAQWVGQPCVTSVHFGHCMHSGLWLATTGHNDLGLLGVTLEIQL